LLINFQDVLGAEKLIGIPYVPANDCLLGDEGIFFKVQPNCCSWDVIMSEPCAKMFIGGPEISTFEPSLTVGRMDRDNYYLCLHVKSSNSCPRIGTITHKLTCPFIFGDDSEHDIVTYWKSREDIKIPSKSTCYCIMIDGNEFLVTQEKYFVGYSEEFKAETGWIVSTGWIVL
jgi:hypothetical protein